MPGTLRFGKAQKLKKSSEISRLFNEGRRWECSCFTLIYGKNGLGWDRFGVLASKRLGNAVERNRVKRVFREVFRKTIKRTPPFFDILLKPRPKKGLDAAEQAAFFDEWQEKVKAGEAVLNEN
jgi:ribonuclease P protein component